MILIKICWKASHTPKHMAWVTFYFHVFHLFTDKLRKQLKLSHTWSKMSRKKEGLSMSGKISVTTEHTLFSSKVGRYLDIIWKLEAFWNLKCYQHNYNEYTTLFDPVTIMGYNKHCANLFQECLSLLPPHWGSAWII